MKKIFSIVIMLVSLGVNSQTTTIPDINFEQKLIALGHDTGIPDGVVTTASISSIASLDVSNSNIVDLTGIEDFTALTILDCSYNQLTSLNVTQNTGLTWFSCAENQITSLDVTQNISLINFWCRTNYLDSIDVTQNINLNYFFCSQNQISSIDVTQNNLLLQFHCGENNISILDVTQNTGLTFLNCGTNQIASLDVTQNTDLTILQCYYNQFSSLDLTQNVLLQNLLCYNTQLTDLDLSQNIVLNDLVIMWNQLTVLDLSLNPALTRVWCYNNPLSCLNVKNGNNTILTLFDATNNPNLNCIEVDNISWSSINWTSIDPASSFSTGCAPCGVGITEYNLSEFLIYPNPTTSQLQVDSELTILKLSIIDLTGKTIKLIANNSNIIDVEELPKGIYFLKLETEEGIVTKKFIKQ